MEDNSSDDLFAKYQKLATEYSKIRAQITVLKKAFTEEQTRANELRDGLKEKDQSVRKLEQEVESLNFRNQQLAKRIGVLQEELSVDNNVNHSTKKSKSRHSTPIHNNSTNNSIDNSILEVLNTELKNKITENESLHLKLNSIEMDYISRIDEMQKQLDLIRSETDVKQKTITESLDSKQTIINKLNEDKERLESRLQICQKEAQEAKLLAENLEIETKALRIKVQYMEESKKVDYNVFDDNKHSSLIGLNVPSVLRSNLTQVRKFMAHFKVKFVELLRSLSNLHSYMEQRINTSCSETSEPTHFGVLQRFAEHLHGNAHYLRRIEESFEYFHQIISVDDMSLILLNSNESLSNVLHNFSNYVSYISKLIPYVIISLSISTSIGGETGAKIRDKNDKLNSCAIRCVNCFSQIETYVKLLTFQSLSPTNFCAAFKHLLRHLNSLYSSLDEVKRVYSSKLVLEHELPTSTDKIKTTDDCILSSIVVLVSSTLEIYQLLESNFELFIDSNSLYKIRGKSASKVHINPAVIKMKERGSQLMTLLNNSQKSPALTVPYDKALQNEEFITNSAETRENLSRQLTVCESKLSSAEQAKEHWMVESQLIQVKLERELKKVQELEAKLQCYEGSAQQTSLQTTTSTPSGSQRSIEMSCTDFAGSSLQSPTASEDKISLNSNTAAEDEIPQVTAYLRNRISQLIENLHLSDSKAVAFHAECVSLQQKLTLSDKERKSITQEIEGRSQAIVALKEELATNVSNYESQLSMMSEHLANMNDKLTQQKDEIDSLRVTHNNKGRKSRNK